MRSKLSLLAGNSFTQACSGQIDFFDDEKTGAPSQFQINVMSSSPISLLD